MTKRIISALLLLMSLVLMVSCDNQGENKYLVLVNKEHLIDEEFHEKIELVETINVYDEVVWIEKTAYQSYLALHDALMNLGVEIGIDSGYRTVEEQQQIMDSFILEYGEEYAKNTVAIPGTSEHHTGLAIDIVIKVGGEWIVENDDMLKETSIFQIIHDNLADFGFIVRYPEGKKSITGYSYEPWHIRYVGQADAKRIASAGVTLEEYLA